MESIFKRLDALAPAPVRKPLFLLRIILQDLSRCDLLKQASAMAYVTLLSMIPSLVAVFCVLSLFAPLVGDGNTLIEQIQDFILENLASGSGEAAVKYLDHMLSTLSLTKIGWSSFASVLITLILLLRQIEGALNRIWLVHKGRNTFTRFMYFWTFLTLGMVVVGAGIGVTSGFDVSKLVGLSQDEITFGHKVASWLVGFGGSFIFFFCLYKIVPNCFVAARNAAMGAATSSLLLNQAGRFYGFYVRDAKNYQTLYGALAQLPLFLMWLYICWIIILLGALISWRAQEGFPQEEEETLDLEKSPLDHLRNLQVQATLPLITLLAIYQNFQQGRGKGLSGQYIAHSLRLPAGWVAEALEALETMGYVVAAKAQAEGDHSDGAAITDPYFPAFPAESLPLAKLRTDLARPMEDWMTHWHHDLPLDIRRALRVVAGEAQPNRTLAQALAQLPAVS